MDFYAKIKRDVVKLIDEKRKEIVTFAQDLIRVPSISGTSEEGAAQKLVADKLRRISGLRIDTWEPDIEEIQKYPFHPIRLSPWNYKNRPNIVGTMKGSGGGRSIILNGHIDVVSPEPTLGWKHHPWGAEIENGRIYGRGSMDMKGGLAAIVYAVLSVRELEVRLRGDVTMESVVEEEYGGGGTVATVVKGYTADGAVIAEPTEADAICAGSCGSRFFRTKVLGKPEWPHLAHYGVNAIGLAMKIYSALLDLDSYRGKRLQGRHPIFETLKSGSLRGPGRATNLTIGILKAGDWPATVAGWAELEGRIGFPPSETGEEVTKEIEETIRKAAELDPWMREHPPTVEWWGARREAYELSPEAPIVQTVKRNVEALTGNSEVFASPAASDASFLVPQVGPYGGIPTIWYGPGGEGGHTFDEHVKIDDIVTVAKVLALSVLDWCGYEE